MLIRTLGIRHYRSCRDVEMLVDDLTAVVGANGCGKSAALRALELFFAPSPRVSIADCYNNDTSQDIEISVTFWRLTDSEKSRFAPYLDGEQLTLTRIFSFREGSLSHSIVGERLRYPDFLSVRSEASADGVKRAYAALPLVSSGELPPYRSRTAALEAIDAWEAANPAQCERVRDGHSFFGYKGVGHGYLAEATKLVFVPAIRDAADEANDGKGSAIAALMDMVVRQTLAELPDYKKLLQDTRDRYSEVFDPEKFEALGQLSDGLTSTLAAYIPDARIEIGWDNDEVDLPPPRARVSVSEDGFPTNIAACGHGLQRAFILTLLQQLASTRPSSDGAAAGDENTEAGSDVGAGGKPIPDLMLVIEEPELFQHPGRQRHLARVLRELTTRGIPGVTQRVQVMFCTHSSHFVAVESFDKVRLFRKCSNAADEPKQTSISTATLADIAAVIARASGEASDSMSGNPLAARLSTVMSSTVSEGFFADIAVLVEGESDRAAILGAAESLDVQLESAGIAVIPCSGKTNILTIAAVFQTFGITTFCIWDGDAGKGETEGRCQSCDRPLDKKSDPKENHRLLRLHSEDPSDNPGILIRASFACFETDLESTLRSEIGATEMDSVLDTVKTEHGLSKRRHAMKNPRVIAEVLRRASVDGAEPKSLNDIVRSIDRLRQRARASISSNGEVEFEPLAVSPSPSESASLQLSE